MHVADVADVTDVTDVGLSSVTNVEEMRSGQTAVDIPIAEGQAFPIDATKRRS